MEIMAEKDIGGLPIINDKNQFIAFISDGDIIRYLSNTYPLFMNAYTFIAMSENNKIDDKLKELVNLKVKDIANTRKIYVNQTDDLNTICNVLSENKIKKVPVLNDEGIMVGIINSSSITKFAIKTCLTEFNKNDC